MFLSLVMCAGMVMPAFAVTYDISQGDVTVHADGSSTGVKQGDTTATTNGKDAEGVIVTGTTTEHNVTVDQNVTDADITLRDANIDVSGTTGNKAKAAMSIGAGSDVTVKLEGENELKSGSGKAGLSVNDGAAVTIKDGEAEGTGKLTATGKSNYMNGSAGIGGDAGKDAGKITIEGGDITANSDATGYTNSGAGIGGGGSGSATEITITGGKVTATVAQEGNVVAGGAGIGGGTNGSGGTIHIGGTADVTAEGAGGAGIGSGYQYDPTTASPNGSKITIDGEANVTATGHSGGAGIGGGAFSDEVDIEISGNATVNAAGEATFSTAGAGIGSGNNYSGQPADSETKITIKDNATVNATGSQSSAGIGGGQAFDGGTIDISTTGKVTATGGSTTYPFQTDSGGAGIGGGADGSAGTINIDGAKDVTAIGGSGAAGIGGGAYGDEQGSITIQNGAVVNAWGGNKAAGIGGGYVGDVGTISISGSNVTATGGDQGAGIGGGCYGKLGAITISGGDIVAISGQNASGIGNGDGGYGGTIAIGGTNSLLALGDFYFAIDTDRTIYTGDQSILNGMFKEELGKEDSNGLTVAEDTEFVVVDAQGNEVKRFILTAGNDGGYLHESFATILGEGTYYVFADSERYNDSIAGYKKDGKQVAYVIKEDQLLNARLMQFPNYSVSYTFESGTEGQALPDAITGTVPAGETGKTMTLEAFNQMISGGALDAVEVEGGTWTFQGWTEAGAITDGTLSDVNLVGTWTYQTDSTPVDPDPVDPDPVDPNPPTPPVLPVVPTPGDDIDIQDEDVPLAGAADLNTEDHFAYITGYPDGMVRPESKVTRAEVSTIFFRLLTEESRAIYWSQENDYDDVSGEDWYNNAVSTLSVMDVLSGYLDGSFKPNASITRAEFAKIAVSFFDYEDIVYDGAFSDVAGDQWYAQYVAAAVELGLVSGYPDGTFRPNESITRAEACAIVNRVLGRLPHEGHLLPETEMITWPDNADKTAWFYADMQEATNSHDYEAIGADEQHDHDAAEQWTEKLAERDWPALEKEWADAYAAAGGEVIG